MLLFLTLMCWGIMKLLLEMGCLLCFFYPCAVFEPSCSWWSFEWGRSEGLVSLVACNWVCLMKHFLLCFDDITWTVVKTYLQDVLFICFMHWDLLLIKIFCYLKFGQFWVCQIFWHYFVTKLTLSVSTCQNVYSSDIQFTFDLSFTWISSCAVN